MTAQSIQKTDIKLNQTLNFKDIEPFCNNLCGLAHSLAVESVERDYFILQ
jgi:hypothetical protein